MQFTIRPSRVSDAPGINALRRMPGVMENTLGMPSVGDDDTGRYLGSLGPDTHAFVAVADGPDGEQIIGNAGLEAYARPRLRHSGAIGIMVHSDYQGMGVGKALMDALIDIADNWLMLVRVELSVFADNERAIRLYEKYGFQVEGTKRMAAVRAGKYEDELMMARLRP